MLSFPKAKAVSGLIRSELAGVRRDAGLYVNYPLCAGRCRFCIYHVDSYTRAKAELFLASYSKEIALYADSLGGFRFRNLHIGGGTPNLAAPRQLAEPLKRLVNFSRLDNFVVEVSPRTDLAGYIAGLRGYNVTKIMLGVQTLDEKILKGEGRFFTRRAILDNMRMLSRSGLSWSLDLVFGLEKHGSDRDCIAEIETALSYKPSGLHLYNIRSQEENDFYGGRKPGDKRGKTKGAFDFSRARELMADSGYGRVGDEWCLLKDKKNAKLAATSEADYGESNIFGLGPAARSRGRRFKYANEADLGRYAALLDRGAFPVGKFFDYGARLYLAANFLLEVNESMKFRVREHFESGKFSVRERRELLLLLFYLKKNKVVFTEKDGVLEVPGESWSLCILLTEKYLKEKGGAEYFYRN